MAFAGPIFARTISGMGSLRIRLWALWAMLAAAGIATGLLLAQFYQQSANVQINRAEEAAGRGCRDIADRYAFVVAGWSGAGTPAELHERLTAVVQAALAQALGVEGGIWRGSEGSLAYAYPTYEGTGPKTDVPAAELQTIRQVNADALRSGRSVTLRQVGRSQVLAMRACPLEGPLRDATAWTMTRVFTAQGPAYGQLMIGLAILAATVLGSAVWLGFVLYSWSRKLTVLESALAQHELNSADLPALPLTGEPELDRLVVALNATGARLTEERRRASAAERLAAVGRLAAGLAHEIRNPIAAMRLKAENAMAAGSECRRQAALQFVVAQISRLDVLLRDLLAMTQRRPPAATGVEMSSFLHDAVDAHRELAAHKGVTLAVGAVEAARQPLKFDPEQMRRVLDNLVINALQNTRSGEAVTISSERRNGSVCVRVADNGPGVPEHIRDQVFEPFVTTRSEGTGLGLAIAREIVRAQGGDVHLVPSETGAVFEVEVPWQPS